MELTSMQGIKTLRFLHMSLWSFQIHASKQIRWSHCANEWEDENNCSEVQNICTLRTLKIANSIVSWFLSLGYTMLYFSRLKILFNDCKMAPVTENSNGEMKLKQSFWLLAKNGENSQKF